MFSTSKYSWIFKQERSVDANLNYQEENLHTRKGRSGLLGLVNNVARNPRVIWEEAASPEPHHPCTLHSAVHSPRKFAPSHGGHLDPSDTGFFMPTRLTTPNSISIESVVSLQNTRYVNYQRTERQTDQRNGYGNRPVGLPIATSLANAAATQLVSALRLPLWTPHAE